ncbi:SGNH/GDSL hydrolase family protein [Actinokineospora sp. HUAS TT18]|uniref:SGNH/GDSL hydrolase family protein n=1 Tax=Actinokineospora sp. HUAS TT18 TaxID=3447451 RepID=UPI003F51DDE6
MKRRIALAAALAATSLLVTAAPSQAADPVNYVALGDSYSAGSGVLPLDPSITPLCARTTRNYPNVIAAATGAQLTDMTCGGAQTKDFTAAQYPFVTQPQFNALSAETDLVTLTIGGNDASIFISAIAACGSAGVVTLGFGSPCKTIYGNYFDNQIDQTVYPAVLQALRDLRAKAPNARVAILGYPWILPATDGCFLLMPIAKGDVPYLRNLQAHLNQVIATAAGQTGVTFVDLAAASEGHDACKPIGTRWVEPALWGTNFVPVHPNALGEAKMAQHAMTKLGL